MKMLTLVLIAAVVVPCGCSDDSSTSPPAEETPLAAATIGPSGGTLQIRDFVLTVPPGAFTSSNKITLWESQEDHGFGANAASRCFRLDGLPDAYSDTLTVSVGYRGALMAETYIAVGTEDDE